MDVFKAISDQTRREILKMLIDKDMNAGDIAKQFHMTKPAISKHLEILRNAELIVSEKQGQFIIYSLNMNTLQNVLVDFLDIFQNVTSKVEEKSNVKIQSK